MIKNELIQILKDAGVKGEIELSKPPKTEMGDFAFGVFGLAKEKKLPPNEVAEKLRLDILKQKKNIFTILFFS